MDQNESHLEGILEEYVRRSSGQLQEGHTITQSVQECMNDMMCVVSSINSNQTNIELGKKKGIECKLCGIEVTTAKELLDHRRNSHLRNRTCPFCGKRNRSVSQTWRHMSTHISRKKNEVNTTLTQQNKNKDHNKISVNKDKCVKKTSYKCNICFQKFQYSGSRDKHVLLHSKNDTNSWKCTICNQVFLQPKLLLKHMSHHESQIKCHMCSEVFSKHSLLRVHLKSHFPDEGKKRFKCSLCPVYCSTPSGLQVHHRIHTGERPYTCGQCNKKFKRVQAVKKHIRAVHGGQNLEDHNCCSCSMKFTCAGNLIRHFLRIHRQVRRYVCGICGARFSQNQDLRRHFKATYKVEMPVISGIDRKALNEIYVIPSIDNLPDSHPHALKINQIVAEEKQKFKGVAELLNQKKVGTKRNAVETKIDTSQHSTNHIYNSPSSSSADIVGKENSSSSSHLPTYPATTNMKLPSCDKCHKVFLGEREYNLHRKSHLCKECEKNFCDEISLQEHMKLHTKKFKCQICMVEFDDKVSFLKHTSEFDEVIVPGEIQRICPNTVSSHKPLQVLISEMPAAEQDVSTRTIGQVPSSEDNYIEVINSTVTNTVGLDEVVRVSGSKQLVTNTDISSVVNTVNLDSMVCSNIDFYVRNIIIQPTPTFIQPVPFTYAAQNALAATPIITLQPAALSTHVPEDQQTQSLMPLNDLRNVMMLNGLDSLHIPLQPPTELYTENLNPPGILISHIPLDMVTTRDPAPVLSNTEFTEEQVEETHVDQRNTNEILTKQTEQETITKEPDKPQGHGKLLCTLCGEQCSSLNSLSRHLKIHTKEKPFLCSQCGKSFSEKHNMKVHLRIHTGERPYTCEECGKQLRYQNDVVDHKRMHLGEKMFVCEECGRKFLRRRELTRHKVTHTGEKRYKCPICSKAFARLDQLKFIHMPTHDDIRVLHKCPICNKSFMQKSSLKQHEILHSGQNKHQCPHCNKTFARGTYLRAHLQTHKKQNEYIQCPKCPRRFTSKDTLQVHEISLHARLRKKNSSTTRKLWKKKSLGNSGDEDNPISEVESTLGMMDIEIQDVDLNIIEGDQCNTVIYLHMEGTEDLKFTLNAVNNELLDE